MCSGRQRGKPGWEARRRFSAGERPGPTREDAGTPAVELGANASGFVGFKVERVPADDCYFCAVKIHGTCEGCGGQGHWGVFGGDYLKHRSFIRATVEMSRGSRPERKKACRADEDCQGGDGGPGPVGTYLCGCDFSTAALSTPFTGRSIR